jgi:hypothetical protein
MGASPSGNQAPSNAAASTTAGVFDYYFKIQSALARDSLKDVDANAWAMAELVRQDRAGVFRPELAAAAEALAGAADLTTARQVFKAASGYVIQAFRAGNSAGGPIRELHCSVYNVSWLQRRGGPAQDPYVGGNTAASPE